MRRGEGGEGGAYELPVNKVSFQEHFARSKYNDCHDKDEGDLKADLLLSTRAPLALPPSILLLLLFFLDLITNTGWRQVLGGRVLDQEVVDLAGGCRTRVPEDHLARASGRHFGKSSQGP